VERAAENGSRPSGGIKHILLQRESVSKSKPTQSLLASGMPDKLAPHLDGGWTAKQGDLRFLLGEIPLFAVKFPLLIQETHFTKLLNAPDRKISIEALPPATEGFLIRSQPVQQTLPRLSLFPDAIRYIPSQYERFYIELEGSFAEYLNKFSSKSRWTLLRKIRKFAAFSRGQVDWRVYRTVKEIEEYYPLARQVSAATYQERLLNAGLPEHGEFRTETFALARLDRVRGYLLFHDRKPIAYLFCAVEDPGILLYRYLGYDPEYQDWSPGTVLQYFVLERLFAEREIRLFDFTEGEGAQKRFLSTGSIHCADIYYFRRRLRTLMVVALHVSLEAFSKIVGDALNCLRLKRRIKTFLRSRG